VIVNTHGRHDPCVGIRATPIAEAMLALVLIDHALRHRAQNADVAPQGSALLDDPGPQSIGAVQTHEHGVRCTPFVFGRVYSAPVIQRLYGAASGSPMNRPCAGQATLFQ
jgi:hypothetical protein